MPLFQLFMSPDEVDDALEDGRKTGTLKHAEDHEGVDEERFAFSRALSRLSEMGSQEWVEQGLGMVHRGGLHEKEGWQKLRSRWREDMM